MYQVVIIGAGPLGLISAIKLALMGVSDIAIADYRYPIKNGHKGKYYTRPGTLDEKVFAKTSLFLGCNLKYRSSSSLHIKTLERALLQIAKKLPAITFISAKFLHLGNKPSGVVLHDNKSDENILLTTEYVFDCSGGKRDVFSSAQKNGDFSDVKFAPVAKNPFPRHLIAYVKMSERNSELLIKPQRTSATELRYLSELRSKFDWKTFSGPEINVKRLSKNKVCIYAECPETLSKEALEDYLVSLLKYHSGEEKIVFERLDKYAKWSHKPVFNIFTINPTQVIDPVIGGHHDYPLCFAIGDSHIEADHRLGLGIISGMKRLQCLLNAISMVQDTSKISEINADYFRFYVR